MRKLWFS